MLGMRICLEILAALGLARNSCWAPLIKKAFNKPIDRFSTIAAIFDDEVARGGLHRGAQRIVPSFPVEINSRGNDCITASGPAIFLSNHPGAYDSLALTSQIPRNDLMLLVSDIPFLRVLENAAKHFIFVDFTASGGMQVLQQCVRNLQMGRTILFFPHREVEPDAEFMDGASEAIDGWSSSIEILLRKVPQSKVFLAITSGVFIPRFVHHPLTWLRCQPPARQKLAEFLQLLHQLSGNMMQKAHVHISFAEFMTADTSPAKSMMSDLRNQARALLWDHLHAFAKPS